MSLWGRRNNPGMSFRRVVVITGCDSGLGWALATTAARAGLITVAGVQSPADSVVQRQLAEHNAHPVQLDVTDRASVDSFRNYVTALLRENNNYRLYALINNAGVMTAGELEWLTPSLMENQVAVNLTGLIRVTSALLPELRRAAIEGLVKPRLINVSSHCALQPLPNFAVYSATKGGVLAFTRALRIELRPYGVNAVTIIPGGFVQNSHILLRHRQQCEEMRANFDDEQLSFHSKKLDLFVNHLDIQPPSHDNLEQAQANTIKALMRAVTDENPRQVYKVEEWRYKFYFILFKIPMPESWHAWLVKKFVCMPDV